MNKYIDIIIDYNVNDSSMFHYVIDSIRRNAQFTNKIWVIINNEITLDVFNGYLEDVEIIRDIDFVPDDHKGINRNMFLHLIPGLSDYFIYMDSSTIVNRFCNEYDFFNHKRCNLKSSFYTAKSEKELINNTKYNNTKYLCNELNIKRKHFDIRRFNHKCFPLYKPLCVEIYHKIIDNIEKFDIELYGLYHEFVGYTSFIELSECTIYEEDIDQKITANTYLIHFDDDVNIDKKLSYVSNHIISSSDNCVDAVICYVDGNDPIWIANKSANNYCSGFIHSNCSTRFEQDNTLLYVLRSIDKYLNFIRNVYLVVQCPSQVPKWIDTNRVKIVYHHDIIPSHILPTYCSTTIEMFLHKIPGLSDRYIYFNDDVFINRELTIDDFFEGYRPKNTLSTYTDQLKFDGEYKPAVSDLYYNINKNNGEIVRKEFGLDDLPIYYCNHGPTSHNRIDNDYLFNKYEDEIIENCTKTRDKNNHNQYLFALYSWFKNGKIDDGTNSVIFSNMVHVSRSAKFIIRNRTIDTFSINSSFSPQPDNNKILTQYLDEKYNSISKYERNITTAVCLISKNEDDYLVEWMEHYKSLGFDNVIFYDNDEVGGAQYDTIKSYIDEGFVIYIDYKSVTKKQQFLAYKSCIEKYIHKFDYIAFFDADEFLYIDKYQSIKQILRKQTLFDKPIIHLNWECYGDSGLIYKTDTSIQNRFNKPCKFVHNDKFDLLESYYVKSIVNTSSIKTILLNSSNWNTGFGLSDFIPGSCHTPYQKSIPIVFDIDGNPVPNMSTNINTNNLITLRHYRTKTIEEYMDKLNRGNAIHDKIEAIINWYVKMINLFFKYNEKTPEKIKIIYEKMSPMIKQYMEEQNITI